MSTEGYKIVLFWFLIYLFCIEKNCISIDQIITFALIEIKQNAYV